MSKTSLLVSLSKFVYCYIHTGIFIQYKVYETFLYITVCLTLTSYFHPVIHLFNIFIVQDSWIWKQICSFNCSLDLEVFQPWNFTPNKKDTRHTEICMVKFVSYVLWDYSYTSIQFSLYMYIWYHYECYYLQMFNIFCARILHEVARSSVRNNN